MNFTRLSRRADPWSVLERLRTHQKQVTQRTNAVAFYLIKVAKVPTDKERRRKVQTNGGPLYAKLQTRVCLPLLKQRTYIVPFKTFKNVIKQQI